MEMNVCVLLEALLHERIEFDPGETAVDRARLAKMIANRDAAAFVKVAHEMLEGSDRPRHVGQVLPLVGHRYDDRPAIACHPMKGCRQRILNVLRTTKASTKSWLSSATGSSVSASARMSGG